MHHPDSYQLEHGTNLFVVVLSPTQKSQQKYHELSK
jgi:hypothetical protein